MEPVSNIEADIKKINERLVELTKEKEALKFLEKLLGYGLLEVFDRYFGRLKKSPINNSDLFALRQFLKQMRADLDRGKIKSAEKDMERFFSKLHKLEREVENAHSVLEKRVKQASKPT